MAEKTRAVNADPNAKQATSEPKPRAIVRIIPPSERINTGIDCFTTCTGLSNISFGIAILRTSPSIANMTEPSAGTSKTKSHQSGSSPMGISTITDEIIDTGRDIARCVDSFISMIAEVGIGELLSIQ